MSSSKESINVDSDGGGWLSTVRSAPPGLLSPSAAARLAAKRKPDIPSFGNDNFPITDAPSITSSRYLERTVFRFGQYYAGHIGQKHFENHEEIIWVCSLSD